MKMNAKHTNIPLSEKISIGAFFCTTMVVLRHSLNLQAFWGTEEINNFCSYVEFGFSKATEIAVPYFFLVSGFFFFRSNYYSFQTYHKMLKKKMKTLLIPFLFWNLCWGVFLYAINFMDLNETIYAKILHLINSDYYGALWYVRTLMIFIVIAPLYDWIFIRNDIKIYVVIGLLLLALWWPVDCMWYSTEGLLFFFMGGVLQRNHYLIEHKLPFPYLLILFIIWSFLCFERPLWSIKMNKLTTLLGIFIFWQLLNLLKGAIYKSLLSLSSMSFFIYVTHFWIVKGMKVSVAHQYPNNEIIALICYFILPILTIGISYSIGIIWNFINPTSFSIVTGGRTKK